MKNDAKRPKGFQRLSVKVIAVLCTTLMLVLFASMAMVSRIIWLDFYNLAERESVEKATSVRAVASSYIESARLAAQRDFALFQRKFADAPLALVQRASEDGGSVKSDEELLWGDTVLNGQFGLVDQFSADTNGAVATVFQRQGDDFLRITTSLSNAAGQRAVGTLLDRTHPAYGTVLRGEKYIGPAKLFGRDYMTVYEPITQEGEVIGILFTGSSIEEHLARIRSIMAESQIGVTGRVFAVDVKEGDRRGGIVGLADEGARIDLANPSALAWLETIETVKEPVELHPTWSPLQQDATGERFVGAVAFPDLGWVIVADASGAEMLATAKHALVFMWSGVAGALILLSGAIVWVINKMVVGPVALLSDSLELLGQGDLSKSIVSKSKDEIGMLGMAMEQFRQKLHSSILKIKRSAETVSSSSQEIAAGNDDLSQRTEEQASALEQTAASMEEMASTVRHNADNATAANQLASAASDVAQRGGNAVTEVVESMHSIRQGSQ